MKSVSWVFTLVWGAFGEAVKFGVIDFQLLECRLT